MEEARKAHHMRWPRLSHGTSMVTGMMSASILGSWTEDDEEEEEEEEEEDEEEEVEDEEEEEEDEEEEEEDEEEEDEEDPHAQLHAAAEDPG